MAAIERATTAIPITMPEQASGPLTLLISDAPTLAQLEKNDIKRNTPTSVAGRPLMRPMKS